MKHCLFFLLFFFTSYLHAFSDNSLPQKYPTPFSTIQYYGAKGNGKADDTSAIQAAINKGGVLILPQGIYRTTKTLLINKNNTIIIGHGPMASIIHYEGQGPAIANAFFKSETLLWCSIVGIRIEAQNPLQKGPIINWNSMQFGSLKDVWVMGNGKPNTTGISLVAIPQKTESTFNQITHSYIGLVTTGIYFGHGANSNTIDSTRVQPLKNGVAIYLEGPISNNRINNSAFEYPNQVSGGIVINKNVHNTLIQGNRFESLAFGWKINDSSGVNTIAVGNYYDSLPKDNFWIDNGTNTKNLDKGKSIQVGPWYPWEEKAKEGEYYLGRWRDIWENEHWRQYELYIKKLNNHFNLPKHIILPAKHSVQNAFYQTTVLPVLQVGQGIIKLKSRFIPFFIYIQNINSIVLMSLSKDNNSLELLNLDLIHEDNTEIFLKFQIPVI